MRAPAIIAALALAGCSTDRGTEVSRAAQAPAYLGVETRLLDGDLVNFRVQMRGARSQAEVIRYGECAAAQYTLIRGFGFLRHVRTSTFDNGDVWSADAVYTISNALPDGRRLIDAEVTVADCGVSGIPTV